MERKLVSAIDQHIIDKVREMRKIRGWSQQELANQMDLSFGFVGNIENPKRIEKWNISHINELAKIFKCSPKDFLPEKPLK